MCFKGFIMGGIGVDKPFHPMGIMCFLAAVLRLSSINSCLTFVIGIARV